MKTNIALIGFMGTGKTVVGKVLADKLQKKFVELDLLIERKAGKSIVDIFQQDGEIAFRELEIEITREVSGDENLVIACGGGVVLNKINIDRLRQHSRIVYLAASPLAILSRTSATSERPLLNVSDQALRIRELLKFRKHFYERAADIKINTTRLDVEAVAEQIIEKLREDESFHF